MTRYRIRTTTRVETYQARQYSFGDYGVHLTEDDDVSLSDDPSDRLVAFVPYENLVSFQPIHDEE